LVPCWWFGAVSQRKRFRGLLYRGLEAKVGVIATIMIT
jgi:hypothetical protein